MVSVDFRRYYGGDMLPPKAEPLKQVLDAKPKSMGGMIEFVSSKYATRERRARVLVSKEDISSVEESYDPEQFGNWGWCCIVLRNGKEYTVKATYDEVVGILIN